MGGGNYDAEVALASRASNANAFDFSGYLPEQGATAGRRSVHPSLSPRFPARECCNETPIVVALDVTRSRGDDTKLMYEKLPMFIGQIDLKGYVHGAGISFAAIGDANSDQAPLQVGQFEADNRLDKVLECFWIEEGGGGTGQESYELAAYYYAHAKLTGLAEGAGSKGWFFFVGDEGFYPTVDRGQVEQLMGERLAKDIDSAEAFRMLQEKFHVFLLFPKKTWEQRKGDIDAEIKSRVEGAGGLYEGVDVRASLVWNNRNDLDLHVIAPSGEHIYYGHKQAACGGWLDVDMNVRGETTKPVENVRWAKGQAPKGRYQVSVQNFAFKEEKPQPTSFRVEIEVGGELHRFDGVVSPKGETGPGSNVPVWQFEFDPSAAKKTRDGAGAKKDEDGAYALYKDDVILAQWAKVIPPNHILHLESPRAVVDVLLGALAIASGATDLDGYVADLAARGQTAERRAVVARALTGVTACERFGEVHGALPVGDPGASRGGRSKRIR